MKLLAYKGNYTRSYICYLEKKLEKQLIQNMDFKYSSFLQLDVGISCKSTTKKGKIYLTI